MCEREAMKAVKNGDGRDGGTLEAETGSQAGTSRCPPTLVFFLFFTGERHVLYNNAPPTHKKTRIRTHTRLFLSFLLRHFIYVVFCMGTRDVQNESAYSVLNCYEHVRVLALQPT